MRPQHTPTTIPAQTKPKSVLDMTVFELSEIDAYQTNNRNFRDEDDCEDLENYFDWEE